MYFNLIAVYNKIISKLKQFKIGHTVHESLLNLIYNMPSMHFSLSMSSSITVPIAIGLSTLFLVPRCTCINKAWNEELTWHQCWRTSLSLFWLPWCLGSPGCLPSDSYRWTNHSHLCKHRSLLPWSAISNEENLQM